MSNTLQNIKIYYILHINNLKTVAEDNFLFSNKIINSKKYTNKNIGIFNIKERRLYKHFKTYPDLTVGHCVPFYYCHRSVMLYIISKQNNPYLSYKGGQESIIHLEFNLSNVIKWAENNKKRWIITDSNAGSNSFNDSNDVDFLNKLDWNAIKSNSWNTPENKYKKQAEFLVEEKVDFNLVDRIGVFNKEIFDKVKNILGQNKKIEICRSWYY